MTAINTTQLEALADLTFEDYKALYLVGQNRAAQYYAELQSQADTAGLLHVENYAILAQSVATNSSINGQLGNYFTNAYAEIADPVIDFSSGSDARLQMQFELMQADLAVRLDNIYNGGTGELGFQDTIAIHTIALNAIGLPPEAFPLYTPLTILAEHDPARAQFLFQTSLAGDGFVDVLQDGLLLGFGSDISSAQDLSDILKDYAAQAEWLNASLEAMEDFVVANSGTQDATTIAGVIDSYQAVLTLAGGAFENIADWAEWFENTSQTAFTALPSWYDSTQTWFGVELTSWWDPLVIDLDGDGVAADFLARQVSGGGFTVTHPVYFDLDGDGYAQATEWHGDGFLARDLNANGRIDNGTELFGTATVNGFEALAAYDLNEDGVINSSDAIWSDLIIWQDLNADGQTQSNELLTLASQDITGIDLTATSTGNGTLTHTGTANTSSGSTEVGNYNFNQDTSNTRYAQDYDFDIRAAFLPTLRGYNQLPDLHIALSLDNDAGDPDSLMAMMQEIASYSLTELFENYDAVTDTIEAILFRWAGVDGVAANSRGDFIEDARQLEFVEALFGQGFIDQNEWGTNPGAVQAREFQDYWDNSLFAQYKGSILAQTVARDFFTSDLSYSLEGDSASNVGSYVFSQDALGELEAAATALSSTAERQAFWLGVTDFIDSLPFLGVADILPNIYPIEEQKLADAIENSDANLVWDESEHDPTNGMTSIQYRYFNPVGDTIIGDASANDYTTDSQFAGTANDDVIIGLGGADVILGGDGGDIIYGHNEDGAGDDGADDIINGQGGDDEIYGGAGNDTLTSGGGSDYIVGGLGNDIIFGTGSSNDQALLEGGEGDDDYYIDGSTQNGENYILDTSGYDEIFLGNNSTFTIENATLQRFLNDDLRILGGDGSLLGYEIFIVDQFTALGDSNGAGVERIRFQEDGPGSTLLDHWVDLKDYLSNYTGTITTIGSNQGDVINGILTGSEDDLIYAYGGNDILSGDAGNDTIYGGDGDDEIHGGIGNDFLYGDTGTDKIWGDDGDDEIFGFGELYGGEGDDKITGYGLLKGEAGNDEIFAGNSGDNTLDGGAGNDTIKGLNGNDELFGGDGDDYLEGKNGVNHLYGGAGNDDYVSGATVNGSENHMFYESGIDTFTGSSNSLDKIYIQYGLDLSNFAISISGNDATLIKDAGVDELFIYGGTALHSLNFDDGFSLDIANPGLKWKIGINGSSSYDTIIGTSGSDILYGYALGDTIHGHQGDDVIYGGTHGDFLHGGDGNDTLLGGEGIDQIWGGAGNDTISYADAVAAVTVNLLTGITLSVEGNDTFSGIENIIGSAYADTLSGDDNANIITGDSGNDTLIGLAGDDVLNGGNGTDTVTYEYDMAGVTANLDAGTATDGNGDTDTLTSIENAIGSAYADTLQGGSGINILTGGDGDDLLSGKEGNDTLYGDAGADTLYGNEGDDLLYGGDGNDDLDGDLWNATALTSGNDTIYGGDGDDDIWGRFGDDTLYGDAGSDTVRGNEGADTIYGGAGLDTLYGQDGDDILDGGTEHDDLYGGAGADIFVLAYTDTFDEIHDFSLGENDKIDVSDLLSQYDPLTDLITDFIHITDNGTHSFVKVDIDGGADNFIQIAKIVNVTGLTDESVLETSGNLITV